MRLVKNKQGTYGLCPQPARPPMMDFLRRFFRRPQLDRPGAPACEKVAEALKELRARSRPCLRLVPGGGGLSRLGGPASTGDAWPRHDGRPLSLIAQLDLAEMRAAGSPDWLPAEGRLLFFYELELSTWGFDPTDAGSALVRHETAMVDEAAEPDDLPQDRRFDAYPITFVSDVSLPSEERLEIDWKALSVQEQGELEAAVEALTPAEPAHQIGGYPLPVQGDGMELECQLVTNGVYAGNPSGYTKSNIDASRPGAADWRLLLQLDTDDAAGMMWGDTGRLYFWIREQDARAGEFSRTWTILQCY